MNAPTLADRVLVHLMRHPVPANARDVPPEVTQDGIAQATGARVAHVSRALKSLIAEEAVNAHLATPHGGRRRARAHTLSPQGRARADEVAEAVDKAAPLHERPVRSAPLGPPAGRDDAFGMLLGAFDDARTSKRLVLIEGESGSGKSRLLSAFRAHCAQKNALVLETRAVPTGDDQDLGPLAAALKPMGFERKLAAKPTAELREAASATAIEMLTKLARDRPVCVLLDDLHAAGARGVDFVRGVHTAIPPEAHVVLACAFRREEAWALPNGPLYSALTPLRTLDDSVHVELGPLDRDGLVALLKDAGADHVHGELVDRVLSESGGVPLYALAMASALEDGVDEEDFFPPTVQAHMRERLSGLAGDHHAVLDAAAVLGADFLFTELAALHPGGEVETEAAVDALIDRLLLEEAESEDEALRLRFTHPKVRDAVLADMGAARRRGLEARLGA